MQYFIDSATGGPFQFDDNVTAAKGADGAYSFTYTTGDRFPDDEDGNQGALIVYPISAPATLQPCTQSEFVAAQQPKPPTAAEVLAANTATQSDLLGAASNALMPLQTAISLGIATDAETASAKAWVLYVRALKAVDLTPASPPWPALPA